MEGKNYSEIAGEGGGFFGEAVRDVGDEVDEVAEGDYTCGCCRAGGRHEDVSLRLVLPILIFKIFAVRSA